MTLVAGKGDLERFIRLGPELQRGDPAYVAPLLMERRQALSPKHNPLFAQAEIAFFLARRDGRVVGRISAQADRRTGETGHFGLLAAEDDREVFAALFRAAENWLRERGRTRILGPFDLSINEEIGVLVDGFETPPMLLMPHNPPSLPARIEAEGYTKAKDVFAYLFDNSTRPAWARRVEKRPLPPGVTLRPLDWKRYEADLAAVVDIFNDAWSGNWNFLPLEGADLDAMAKSMKPLIVPDFVQIAEVNGEPAAFGICLPNLNEAIRDLSGSLVPLGWAKLLWRLKVKGVSTARIPLMGVRRSVAKGATGAFLPMIIMSRLGNEAAKKGIRHIEMSWILEDNAPMRHFGQTMAGDPYKTYRIYEKALRA
ncbi:GNAT family N-acetyltransferase [Aureimonas leprariae]|uniref:GNAT family N-acetyltransferase n=1 Tax=Plantimonas leprariae TaxID=2615207 RepID=UPI001FE31E43|nr:GNAT family N-acetyltransferase [Aureimonas leprariae]